MKNANIKSEEELAERLIAGEEFDYNGGRVWYDFESALKGKSPFRFGTSPLDGYWDDLPYFKIKQNWYDTVSEENPVICMCWDKDGEEKMPRIITGYDPKNKQGNIYRASNSFGYKNAEPVPADSPLIYKGENQ